MNHIRCSLLQSVYDVIIIGGGIVGVGIARDLSLRGANVLLLDKGGLASGATGRSHALLHSGARYVVKDPISAKECANENTVLRNIANHIIEDTGGLFISTSYDPEYYIGEFQRGCRRTGVFCKELNVSEARKIEPNLNANIKASFFVNDAHIDPFRLTFLNALDAIDNGAEIEVHTKVIDVKILGKEFKSVKVKNLLNGEISEVKGDILVVAAGAWNGKILGKIGINLDIRPSKGSIIVYSKRVFNKVINRLRPPSDGDIIVPSYGTSLVGTTSISVEDPEDYVPSINEIIKLRREAVEISKIYKRLRIIKAYSGPRPLIGGGDRETSRGFKIFDHWKRDDIKGVYSIAGGKLTTYRLMAEKISDIVAVELGLSKHTVTHKEPLPGFYDSKDIEKLSKKYELSRMFIAKAFNKWGGLIKRFFDQKVKPELVCFCEHVTLGELTYLAKSGLLKTLGDAMRGTRATMGPCQGQNCLLRVATILMENVRGYDESIVGDIVEQLEKKWKLNSVILDGSQAEQIALHKAVFSLYANFDELEKRVGNEK